MQTMMRIHLNQVVALAVDQLEGHYPAAITLYNAYIGHLLDMADMLSGGIMQRCTRSIDQGSRWARARHCCATDAGAVLLSHADRLDRRCA
jgi:hypothetical protein